MWSNGFVSATRLVLKRFPPFQRRKRLFSTNRWEQAARTLRKYAHVPSTPFPTCPARLLSRNRCLGWLNYSQYLYSKNSESSQGDYSLFREVRAFARKRAILPFVFTTAFLLFLLVNLGSSSSDEKMGQKVLIGALLLAFLQFCIIPAIIWRPSDERTNPVSTFHGKSSSANRRKVVGGLEEEETRTVTRVTTMTVQGRQQKQRTEWEDDEEWVEEEEEWVEEDGGPGSGSSVSGSPSPRCDRCGCVRSFVGGCAGGPTFRAAHTSSPLEN